MGKKRDRLAETGEEIRRTLDAAHESALRAVEQADTRAAKAERSARRHRARAATALEVASEELATLAAALRETGEPAESRPGSGNPLDGLAAQIDAEHPEPRAEPAPRARTNASRRASLHDSPIAAMFQDSDARRPDPVDAAEPPETAVARGRPGLVETWRRRVSAL
jgi:hypothetical protein